MSALGQKQTLASVLLGATLGHSLNFCYGGDSVEKLQNWKVVFFRYKNKILKLRDH